MREAAVGDKSQGKTEGKEKLNPGGRGVNPYFTTEIRRTQGFGNFLT